MAQSKLTPSRKDAKTKVAFAISAALILVSAAQAQKQAAPAGAFEFDVASVRFAPLPTQGSMQDLLPSPIRVLPGDRFETRRFLRSIIAFAYGFERPFDHVKGSDPILNEIFAVSARGTPGSFAVASPDGLQPVRHMVQRLLTERFNLEAHVEQEPRHVLLLKRDSLSKLGPALRQPTAGCARVAAPFPEDRPPDGSKLPRCSWAHINGTLTATGTLHDLAIGMSGAMQQEIIDETGLTGVYLVAISFDPDTFLRLPPGMPRLAPAAQHSDLPGFETVLKSDLGLVLEKATRTVPVLVITHIEPLREN